VTRTRARRGTLDVVVACGILIATAGCLDRSPPIPVVSQGQPLSLVDERVERILEAHGARVAGRQGLQGTARVALSGPDFKLDRPQRIALERPARLRFEILGLFDQLAAILVTDRAQYAFFDASTGEVARGRVSSALLWNLAKIDLSPEELVGLLLAAPRPELGSLRAAAWLEPSGRVAVAFAGPGGHAPDRCVLLDPLVSGVGSDCHSAESALYGMGGEVYFFAGDGDGDVDLVEVRGLERGGVIRYRVRFEEYAAIDGEAGPRFPRRVTFESPLNASEARFDWKRVRFANEMADGVFQLPEPRRS